MQRQVDLGGVLDVLQHGLTLPPGVRVVAEVGEIGGGVHAPGAHLARLGRLLARLHAELDGPLRTLTASVGRLHDPVVRRVLERRQTSL